MVPRYSKTCYLYGSITVGYAGGDSNPHSLPGRKPRTWTIIQSLLTRQRSLSHYRVRPQHNNDMPMRVMVWPGRGNMIYHCRVMDWRSYPSIGFTHSITQFFIVGSSYLLLLFKNGPRVLPFFQGVRQQLIGSSRCALVVSQRNSLFGIKLSRYNSS